MSTAHAIDAATAAIRVTVGRAGSRLRAVRSRLFDLMVAGVVALFALLVTGPVGSGHHWRLKLVGLGMAVAVLMRRRYPQPVMVVVSVLAGFQVLLFPAGFDPLPFDVAVLVAMYSVVKYARRVRDALLAAVPVGIGIAIEVARHAKNSTQVTSSTLFLLAICGGIWLTGYTVRTRRLYTAGLEERAVTAERERDQLARLAVADERAAIARELHDMVAHSLSVMIVQADGASYAVGQDPEQARTAIRQVAATGRDALEDMRRLVGVLRGAGRLDEAAGAAGASAVSGARGPDRSADPADAPDHSTDRRRIGMAELPALLDRARSAGVRVEAMIDSGPQGLPSGVELTVYRIVQEGLTNVLRHAGPGARVRLRISHDGEEVTVELTDDGGGRLAGNSTGTGGHGLIGMRERVAVHSGSCEVGPLLGGGWRVLATLQVPARTPAIDRVGR